MLSKPFTIMTIDIIACSAVFQSSERNKNISKKKGWYQAS